MSPHPQPPLPSFYGVCEIWVPCQYLKSIEENRQKTPHIHHMVIIEMWFAAVYVTFPHFLFAGCSGNTFSKGINLVLHFLPCCFWNSSSWSLWWGSQRRNIFLEDDTRTLGHRDVCTHNTSVPCEDGLLGTIIQMQRSVGSEGTWSSSVSLISTRTLTFQQPGLLYCLPPWQRWDKKARGHLLFRF